jgi:hypothetical protein
MKFFSTKLLFSLFLLTGLAIVVSNCKKDEETCDTTNVSFKDEIKPLLQDKGCLASDCHSAADQYAFDTYANVKFVVDAGRMLGAIRHELGFSKMPKNGAKLDSCSIKTIEAWIVQGAKDN